MQNNSALQGQDDSALNLIYHDIVLSGDMIDPFIACAGLLFFAIFVLYVSTLYNLLTDSAGEFLPLENSVSCSTNGRTVSIV
uniref:Ion_trans domain-containing protein n=1 Tax=Steinernema glaseri TaxID=37863 RepID=A0A1I8A390_9BILA